MQGFRPRRTIYLGFGHDEERGSRTGREGAQKIAEFLKARGVHAEVALDEGLSMLKGGASLVKGREVALIGLAQKGYVSLRISASSRGGHSMAPPVDHSTAIEQLARAITTLQQAPVRLQHRSGRRFAVRLHRTGERDRKPAAVRQPRAVQAGHHGCAVAA